MNVYFLFIFFGTIAQALGTDEWTDLHCRFAVNDTFRLRSFYQLPRTLKDAQSHDWVQPSETSSEKHLTTLCWSSDASICLLYDMKGTIAAYQISIPKIVDDLNIPRIDYTAKSYKPTILFGQQWYSIRIYLSSQVSISSGGRKFNYLTGTGLWIPIKGQLVKIPRKQKNLERSLPVFKKQNCVNQMGLHYFYNLTRSLEPEGFQPLFLLYSKNGNLVGFGHNAFGSKVREGNFPGFEQYPKKRDWFESAPGSAVRSFAPGAPDWAIEYFDKYGMFRHHVYLGPQPWTMTCK